MFIKIAVIAAYAIMIIVVGILGLRKTKSFSDFFLGGGNIGPWMTAFTYGTAYFSAVLFIGFAGKIGWGFGYSGLWIALGNALVGVLGVWWILGWRIKQMSLEYNVHTMAEYFEKRYDSRFLKLFSSSAIFIFFIPYTAAVFMGLSYLFRSTFGIDYTVALIAMGLFTALYLVLGGYKSMTMIDVVFGVIMIFGVLILLVTTISKAGGLANITAGLEAINPKLTEALGPPGLWPLFSLVFLTSVAPFAMPQLVQKFYAIKDKRSIRVGMIASTLFALLIGGIGYFTGATTRFFLNPENSPGAFANGKPVFDALMPELFANIIPESLSIVMLLLILSASMSTLAALVLISSSSFAKDIYAGFINKNVSDRKLTMLMRISSVFFVLLSVILAYLKPSTIVSILGLSWGAIGSVFLGPFLWGLFTKWANKVGAIASAIIGLATCVTLYNIGWSSPEAGTIGMIVSLAACPVFSLLGKK
ncbi:MAG: sodium/solute symporter [candidate division Zixibacteria bacterium]|nr:sodium/solute symporter [candidate division Zixibacteria bacterium]